MKVFLRHRQTGLYRTCSNRWVAVTEKALGFTSVPEATRFALDAKLPEAELVLKFELQPEVTLPLLREWCDLLPPGAPAN